MVKRPTIDPARFPVLASLLASGDVFIDGWTIVGRTGTETVQVGSLDFLQGTESYLSANPRPDQW